MNNLGVLYKTGLGVTKDLAEAVKWYRKAADAGSVLGQSNLGVCLEEGYGTAVNLNEAVQWYRKAAAQGNETAKQRLENLKKQGKIR
jgi:hypothetical protein